jgi:hypothetical protein
MKKALKWIGIALVGLIVLGAIINATKSPEQKAAEAAAHEQERAKRSVEDAIQAEKKQEQAKQDGVPKCDGSVAKDLLRKSFDQSQFARTLNLSAVEVSTARELTFDSSNSTRKCFATVVMNNTEKMNLDFKMEKRSNGIMLTFEESKSSN